MNRSGVYHCYKCSTSGFPGRGATTEEQAVASEETGIPARRKKRRGGKKHKKGEPKADDESGSDVETYQGGASSLQASTIGEFLHPGAAARTGAGRGLKRPLTEAEKAKEGRSRSSGVACKEPYAHFASLSYAIGAIIVSVAMMARTYKSFDFVVTAVEESAGEIVESFATDIQWFNQTIIQVLLVCVVTIVAIATQRCANYFSSSPEPEEEEEEDSEELLPEAPPPALLAPVPAF